MIPNPGFQPKFAQIYIYDTENELKNRLNIFKSNLNENLLKNLQQMMHTFNPFAQSFRSLGDQIKTDPFIDYHLIIKCTQKHDKRKYNAPTSSEVAVLIQGEPTDIQAKRDIIIKKNSGHLQNISSLHQSYDPLHFVLLFPHGCPGFHIYIPFYDKSQNETINSSTILNQAMIQGI